MRTRTSVEVVRSAYATALEGFALPYGDITVGGWRNTPYVVIQNVGAYLDVPRFLDSDHRIENAADAEAYLARLQSYAKQLDGELGRMQAARARGPRAAGVSDRQGAGADEPVGEECARRRLARRVDRAADEETFPGNWAERARTIAAQEIAPALERQIAELQAQRAVATNDAGISARPHGEEFYRWALKASTTTNMSPDEVHEMGQSELQRLHAQMDAILKEIGYTQGTVGERMKALAKDPRYQFAEGDKGRAEIMAFINESPGLDPGADAARVQHGRESEHGSEAAAAGGRARRAGRVRRRRIDRRQDPRPVLDQPQDHGPAQQVQPRRSDVPRIDSRPHLAGRIHARHAARSASCSRSTRTRKAGDSTPSSSPTSSARTRTIRVGRLGYLQSIAFRACRLVVDTGIHAKRWTREQGVQFFVDVNGSNPLEVASEVDRYCSWPGQACGYKVGHSEINRQREKAKAALGAKFDLKAFDDTVVLGGNVPLDVLAKNVDEYVRTAGAELTESEEPTAIFRNPNRDGRKRTRGRTRVSSSCVGSR